MAMFLGFWVFLGITCAIVCGGLVMGAVMHAAPWVSGGHDRSDDADADTDADTGAGAGPGAGSGTAAAAQWIALAPELARALRRAGPTAGRLRVALAHAAQPGLGVQTDRRALRAALASVLDQAMHAAPGGKVLLTARREGWVIELAVLDDGGGADTDARRGALRPVESALALQGGSLEVAAIAGEGTTMRLRLPAPAAARGAVPVAATAAPAAASPAATSPAGDAVVSFAAG